MNERLDWEKLNEIANEKIDIIEVIERYQEPARFNGTNVLFHCCNNSDSTPSLTVNTDKNLFKCFSCGAGGNALSYLLKEVKLPFQKAVKLIAEMSGEVISAPVASSETLKCYKRIRSQAQRKASDKASQRVYKDYDDYLKFSDELPQEWIDEGIDPDVMRKFNIRVDNDANRIVYPVYDSDGRYICAKGRTRLESYKLIGLSKYQNYSKIGTTDYFCGMKENLSSILYHNKVIVVEGLKSVMKLCGWGYDYALSAETSSLNDAQIKLLIKLGIAEVTIAFDKDKKLDQIRNGIGLLNRFANVYVIYDTKGLLEDKDSPVDKGKDVFEKLLSERIRI